jgi:lysozyme
MSGDTTTGTKSEIFDNQLNTDRPGDKQIPIKAGFNVAQSGLDILNTMVERFFTVEKNDGNIYEAICLHNAIEGQGKDYKIKVRARIPAIHGHLPLPRNGKDYAVMMLYPEYVAENESTIGGKPQAGQIIEVVHKNNNLLFHGYGTGKIRTITGGQGAFTAGIEEPSEPFKACFENYPPTGVTPKPSKIQEDVEAKALELAKKAYAVANPGTEAEATAGWNALPADAKVPLLALYHGPAMKELKVTAEEMRSPTSTTTPFKDREFEGQPCSKFFKLGDVIQGDRKVSAAGEKLLHLLEGVRVKPYRDSARDKWWTVGMGSLIDKRRADGKKRFKKYKEFVIANKGGTEAQAEAYQGTINEDQMNILADQDIIRFEKVVNKQFPPKDVPLTQNQFEALVSFAYNAGSVHKPLREAVRMNPNDPAIGRIWVNQTITAGGDHSPGLIKRRKKEVDFYFGKTNAVYTPPKSKTKTKPVAAKKTAPQAPSTAKTQAQARADALVSLGPWAAVAAARAGL